MTTKDPARPDARRFALGVGLTNACNLQCAHCYRGTGTDALSVDEVMRAVAAIPTRAVNFGTGENGLHPDFARLIEALDLRGVAVTMTTNGMSAEVLPDDVLARFADVEMSIDHPDERAHDGARGAGNWALIERQMARCRGLGVRTAIVAVVMAQNHDRMPELVRLAGDRGAMLRVNVYQSVQSDAFALSYAQFWRAFRDLFDAGDVIACAEPIVTAMLGWPRVAGTGCGVSTVRITPRGDVAPCVYDGATPLSIADLERVGAAIVDEPSFARLAHLPEACQGCPHASTCGGGCAARRTLAGGLDRPDPYCPIVRGQTIELRASRADSAEVSAKAASACTTIVRPRAIVSAP